MSNNYNHNPPSGHPQSLSNRNDGLIPPASVTVTVPVHGHAHGYGNAQNNMMAQQAQSSLSPLQSQNPLQMQVPPSHQNQDPSRHPANISRGSGIPHALPSRGTLINNHHHSSISSSSSGSVASQLSRPKTNQITQSGMPVLGHRIPTMPIMKPYPQHQQTQQQHQHTVVAQQRTQSSNHYASEMRMNPSHPHQIQNIAQVQGTKVQSTQLMQQQSQQLLQHHPGWVVPNPLQQSTTQHRQPQGQNHQGLASSASNSSSSSRPKVVLSPETRQALANAIWSAIRSPSGEIDSKAMEEAIKAGLPKHAILNAARVAREREAQKRHLNPHIKVVQQNSRIAPTSSASSTSVSSLHSSSMKSSEIAHHPLKSVSLTQKPTPIIHSATVKQTTIVSSSTSALHSTSSTSTTESSSITPRLVNSSQVLKLDERNFWRRAHSGVFFVQKGRYLGLPHSISCIERAPFSKVSFTRSRLPIDIMKSIQNHERNLSLSNPISATLLNPESFKRVKMEPKRVSKALERSMKKSRQTTQENLLKRLKDLHKTILAHASDFYKYHKSVKSEASKIARAVRDKLSKQSSAEQKRDEVAERARLAALKANDMEAYKSLLEDTKNERLQYLWKKTDECLDQISNLLQQRNDIGGSLEGKSSSSYYAAAHFRMEEVRQPTILAGGELKEYQLAGLQWLVSLYNNKLNGILADEMGLGKTIQAISLIAYLMEIKENLGPYLVIVPLSTLSNWVNEFVKWCPTCRVIVYKGTPAQRREIFKNDIRNGQFNVLLTTYEFIIKDKGSLKKVVWQYAIVDEGHRMKNAQSKFAVTLGTVYTTNNRILLTGTPLQNNLPELWALLNFLLPAIFNSVESFDQWFNRPFATFSNSKESDEQQNQILSNEERMLIIHRLHELLRPFMLRRVKSEVLDQLPEKVEKVLRCDLSSWQKELYKQISYKATVDNKLESFLDNHNSSNFRGLNNVVMQLRKVCNHPYLFSTQGYLLNDDLIRSSGKFQLLDDMLPKLKAAGHRILMFTQMTAVMTILEDYFRYRGFTSLRLDGSTPADERERRMYKFNAPDSPHFIFLLSTRAGGLGLNLATADVVIIFDSDWNPMMDLQAQDRAHRIGQRSDVSVFRLITYSPVEEKILARANEKLNMSELVVEAGKFNQESVENDNSLERKKIMEILLTDFESSANKSNERMERNSEEVDDDDDDKDSTSNSNDINELLSNNEQDYQIYVEMDEQRSENPHPSLYVDSKDVPDWIKYPQGSKEASENNIFDPDAGRKRNSVSYDDGLTEKQFLRLMESKAEDEESNNRKRKAEKLNSKQDRGGEAQTLASQESGGKEMTEWTVRKLINICKAVIALKDPPTKRRLSEIFLEKPDPNVYPDYYTVIERPIAINDILRKCRGHLFVRISEFWDDWKLLFDNAKKFNGEGSWVANDADALKRELERLMKKNGLEDQPAPIKQRKKLRIKLSLKAVKPDSDAYDESSNFS